MDQGSIAQSRAWLAVGREIAETLERVNAGAFERFVDVFRDESRRWFFLGQGRSGMVAEMAAMRFMHMGRSAHFTAKRPLHQSGPATGSASYQAPVIPRSPSTSLA